MTLDTLSGGARDDVDATQVAGLRAHVGDAQNFAARGAGASKSLGICGLYRPRALRSPYADSRESLAASIHAVALNRSGNQSTRIAAPENRYERAERAADAADSTARTYEWLT
jgi:hypothetical protein